MASQEQGRQRRGPEILANIAWIAIAIFVGSAILHHLGMSHTAKSRLL